MARMNSATRAENCDRLAAVLDRVDGKSFNQGEFGGVMKRRSVVFGEKLSCGTPACAAGWSAVYGLVRGFEMVEDGYGGVEPQYNGKFILGRGNVRRHACSWVYGHEAGNMMWTGRARKPYRVEWGSGPRQVARKLRWCARRLRKGETE